MAKKKVTAKNFDKVVENYKEFFHNQIKGDRESEKAFLTDFNHFLDELRDNDVFGTEGQCDPRGDNRD
jgi:hypothetical protein